jgi:putative restriction endonuclease
MARLEKSTLLQRFIDAVSLGDWHAMILTPEHPYLVRVFSERDWRDVRIYIWNITHGGGAARAQDEYRIQITGVDQIESRRGEITLLLGWDDRYGLFVGFDANQHLGPVASSPSIQVREDALTKASTGKYALHTRGTGEIAVCFKPEFLIQYIISCKEMHQAAGDLKATEILDSIGEQDSKVTDETIDSDVSWPRQRTARELLAWSRNSSFRHRVISAYRASCAFCGTQLKLVEAAHIIPVAVEGSTDETSNGVALCSLHHRAFDKGLVSFKTDFQTEISESKLQELRASKLDSGFEWFAQSLRPVLLLPADKRDWPDSEFVQLGRNIRGWD